MINQLKKYITKKKWTKKKIVLIIIGLVLVLVVGNGIYKKLTTNIEDTLNIYKVTRQDLMTTVSEAGIVNISDEIGLSFKYGGKIDNIYVEIGDKVKRGESLVKVDSSDFFIQYQQTDASVQSAQAQLDKLLAGATLSDINIVQAQLESAKVSLQNKEESLANTKLDADNDIADVYQNAINNINDVYLDTYNVYTNTVLIQRTYFGNYDQEGINVSQAKDQIKTALDSIKLDADNISSPNITNENIDSALIRTKTNLDSVYGALDIIRNAMETDAYRNSVSSANKTIVDTDKSTTNTNRTLITTTQQTISSTKITNTTNISAADALVRSAKRSVDETEKSLQKLLAGPTQEDINIYKANLARAQAERSAASNKVNESTLRSPVDGQVVKINVRVGEIASINQVVMYILPEKPFQVKVDIYEEDIAKIKIGNLVDIKLVAFPDTEIAGKVSSIDPIDKTVNEVVYYEVSMDFDQQIEGLKPGMTADIVIIANKQTDLLIIPESSIIKETGKNYVKVLDDKKIIKKEVLVGNKGDDAMIEIKEGLQENDKVILP
ncbi:MAG: efflux RND transporter periplasmic adaptor subunit [Candidatus Paceibacterota bacterium]|jgi:RND family efflux transporter MFP subunit